MTVEEFSNEFDVKLNSYLREHPFGTENGVIDFTIDEYQKSIFLTESLYEFVRGFYTGQESFEQTEEIRRDLSNIIDQGYFNNSDEDYEGGFEDGFYHYFFPLIPELWWITFEEIKLKSEDPCINNKTALVKPVTQDELFYTLQDPFKCPNKNKGLRLDMPNGVEIISKYKILGYNFRYIRKPLPIITTYLPEGVTIEGMSEPSGCELNDSTHKIILTMAVEKAYRTLMLDKLTDMADKTKKTT